MTPRQLEIIQHALGTDKYGRNDHPEVAHRDEFYRNHFCAGGKDEEVCRELVALGYMKAHEKTEWLPYYNCSVTPSGIKAMKEERPSPPKLSRSQIRYREFLRADTGMTFKEWVMLEGERKQYHSAQHPALD